YNIISSDDLTCEVTYQKFDENKRTYITDYSGSISIPEKVINTRNNITYSVTSIGKYAFSSCSGLTSVTMPNSVTSIGYMAFHGCSKLRSIILPHIMEIIDEEAFAYSGLISIILPDSVTNIGTGAFAVCDDLMSVTMPKFVTNIGDNIFNACPSLPVENKIRYADWYLIEAVDKTLSTYAIKNGTKWINSGQYSGAFRDCKNMKSIESPNTVMYVKSYAFANCTSLESVIVNIEDWSNANVFATISTLKDKTFTYKYKGGELEQDILFPSEAIFIGENLLYKCTTLKSIEFPKTINSVGENAFNSCTNLSSIKVHWKRPLSVPLTTFNNIDKSKCTLYVPKGTEMLYWVAPVWSEFTNIVEYDEPEDVSYYITINGLEGGEIMQKVDIGMTYSYKFKPYEEWEINSVTFNGVDVTSQLQDSIFSTPAIAGNSTLSVVYKKVSSAIDAVEGNDDVRILATSGAIVINGAKAGKAVSVYGLNGNMVESTKTNGASTIVSLPQKGVYIVKVGNGVFKVSI
ncbi:MAG: leucine-rich repeat domain-containing protein, partial [Prevotella sp.]|nr:leucine-rich repeat domain-containing protein [Candidatus Equicola stercoris]